MKSLSKNGKKNLIFDSSEQKELERFLLDLVGEFPLVTEHLIEPDRKQIEILLLKEIFNVILINIWLPQKNPKFRDVLLYKVNELYKISPEDFLYYKKRFAILEPPGMIASFAQSLVNGVKMFI
jgi:hypothetical protein